MPLKLRRKYFHGTGASMSYLEKPELLCLYSSLDIHVASHTGDV